MSYFSLPLKECITDKQKGILRKFHLLAPVQLLNHPSMYKDTYNKVKASRLNKTYCNCPKLKIAKKEESRIV